MDDLFLVCLRDSCWKLPVSVGSSELHLLSPTELQREVSSAGRVVLALAADQLDSSFEDVLVNSRWMAVSLGQAVLAASVLNDYGMVRDFSLLAERYAVALQLGDYGIFSVVEGGLVQFAKFFEVRGWTSEKLQRLPVVLAEKNGFAESNMFVGGFALQDDYSALALGLRRLAQRYGLEASSGSTEPSSVFSEPVVVPTPEPMEQDVPDVSEGSGFVDVPDVVDSDDSEGVE